MAWDWSGADTPMPGLRGPAGISDIIRQSVLMSQDTWQRDTRDSCDNVNSNISLLFCAAVKVSPQNVSIVRDSEWGPGPSSDRYQQVTVYIFISTDTPTLNVLISFLST